MTEERARQAELYLVGMVCYYGKHYSTFFFQTKIRKWMYFDDAHVKEVRRGLGAWNAATQGVMVGWGVGGGGGLHGIRCISCCAGESSNDKKYVSGSAAWSAGAA